MALVYMSGMMQYHAGGTCDADNALRSVVLILHTAT